MGFIKRLLAKTTLDDRLEYFIYSRTFWLNAIGIVIEILSAQQVIDLPWLAFMRTPNATKTIAGVLFLLNLILRYQGGAPLTFRRPVE